MFYKLKLVSFLDFDRIAVVVCDTVHFGIHPLLEHNIQHWRSSHYAVTHARNKIVTFKGGHLMW